MKKRRMLGYLGRKKGGSERFSMMKVAWMLVVGLMLGVSPAWGQEAKVKAKWTNAPLREVFNDLKEQTGYVFVYNEEELDRESRVTLEADGMALREVMERVLAGLPYSFEILERMVVVKPKKAEVLEPVTIRGRVTDTGGNSLPGVTVQLKGVALGTVTDNDGRYQLMLQRMDHATLVFSFVGMKRQEVRYVGQDSINVVMEEDVEEMEEVVVTGYGNIERRKLTSSVISVKGEDLLEGAAISLDQMLQGKLAGVTVLQATSTPGAAPKIRIRGSSSITGNREPVWVVDGVILDEPVSIPPEELNSLDRINLIGNAISFLNPEDIERVDILKDASATAIYGTKAANGVIVVTTKKGKRGAPSFSYTLSMSLMSPPNNKNMERMNSKDRIEMSEEMQERGLEYNGFKPSHVAYEGALMDLWDKKITYEEFLKEVKRLKELNTDWYGLLFRTSFSHAHTISVSGGGDKSDYYFSLGYADDESVTKEERLRRFNGMLKLNTYFNEKLWMGIKMSGSWTLTDRPHTSIDLYDYAYNTSRAIPAYDDDGNYFFYAESNGYNSTLPFNIFNELDHSDSEVDNMSLNMSLTLNWRVFSWLNYDMMFSFARSNTSQTYWADEESYYVTNMRQIPFGEPLPDPKVDTYFAQNYCALPFGGVLQNQETRNYSYTWRHSLAFNKVFLDKHALSANVGFELRSTKYDGLQTTEYGYLPKRGKKFVDVDILQWPNYANTIRNTPNVITDTKDNFISYYGTFSYEYDRRYIFNFNIRADGSNKFGQDKSVRFLPVWSVSTRWNVKNEAWMGAVNFVDDLSIRASYGLQGNVHPDQTPNLIVNMGTLDAMAQEYSSTLYKFPNTRLTWEKTKSFNLGIDFSFFKNFIYGTVELYKKKGEDQIVTKNVAPSTGASQVSYNSGDVENKGWELSVNLQPINTKSWVWGISFNTSKNYNKVVNAGEQVSYTWQDYVNGTIVANGKALNSFYSYKFNGLDAEGLPTFKDIEERDEEGNLLVHSQEEAFARALAYSGKREPDLSGGFSTYLRYKSISLSCQFAFNLGNKIRLNDLYLSSGQELPYPAQNMSSEYVNRWRKPGDEEHTNIPVLSEENLILRESDYEYPIGSSGWEMYNKSDLRVVSGNFLRCRSLSLRYTFSSEFVKKLYMKGASLTFDAGNLFVIKSKDLKGRDPEQASMGSHTIPPQRSYSLRLNVVF